MAQILIIEDEALLAKSLARSLMANNHDCLTAPSAEEGLAMMEKIPVDIVLLDLQLPGMSGLEAIKHIRNFDSNISVIIATAYATMASAVEAMRSGACDFLRKPLDTEEVLLAVDRAVSDARLKQTVSYYHDVAAEKADENRLVCNSDSMRRVSGIIDKLAGMDLDRPSDYPPLLILGETGTGKDMTAQAIHFRSKYSEQPFIEVNCTTLPRGLEEAELFGYEKGSFTGADRSKRGLFDTAANGTIFLNEIGDMTAEAQTKLLQVIEQKCLRRVGGLRDIEVDVRIIAATNRKLENSDSFRQDLFYRLNSMVINMPPLRERREDIVALANLFLSRFSIKYKTAKRLDSGAEESLLKYQWPGNVRELRQLMERVTFLNSNEIVSASDLSLTDLTKSKVTIDASAGIDIQFPKEGIELEGVEREIILQALKSCQGNLSEAARKLHIGREALRYRIKKFDISKSIKIDG